MKLSEVIKAIEDGKVEKAKSDRIIISRHGTFFNIFLDNAIKLAIKLDDEWQEVKPPRQWSENELMLFKVFHWAKWLSRERNGDILLSETKPEYVYDATENYSYWEIQDSEEKFATISTENYEDVTTATFEESPVYIGDLKGE